MGYPPTPLTTPLRARDRMAYDAEVVHAILDEAYLCHVGFMVDGAPRVLPMLHARVGGTLYLHGSTGGRLALAARGGDGLTACVAVTLLDGLVLARSQFHHSVNYRSVVAHGTARLVTDDAERRRGLTALVERIATGRAATTRPPDAGELAKTAVLAVELRDVAARARRGGVADEPEDLALPHWAGVVGLRASAGRPEPDAGVTTPVPEYLLAGLAPVLPARSAWHDAVPLRGRHVTLERLDLAHADELWRALDDPEVWRHVPLARPADAAGMATTVRAALDEAHAGTRVPWVQRDAATGRIIGTTSYHDPDPHQRSVHIGSTLLGRPWWRTGVNTESKLLLLTRAFDELGAVRVEWITDTTNERSQRAIERLGAVREGVLRRHLRRADGSWRDSALYSMTDDEWPAARDRLAARLTRG